MAPDDLRAAIDKEHPVMLTLQAYRDGDVAIPYSERWEDGHYVVAIGYDDKRIIFEDPASFHRTFLSDGELVERWHDYDGGTNAPKLYGWGCTLLSPCEYKPDYMERME